MSKKLEDPKPVFDFLRNSIICGTLFSVPLFVFRFSDDVGPISSFKIFLFIGTIFSTYYLFMWNWIFFNQVTKGKSSMLLRYTINLFYAPILVLSSASIAIQNVDKVFGNQREEISDMSDAVNSRLDKIEANLHKIQKGDKTSIFDGI